MRLRPLAAAYSAVVISIPPSLGHYIPALLVAESRLLVVIKPMPERPNLMNTFKKLLVEFLGTGVFLVAIAGSTASGSPLKQIALALSLGLMILIFGGVSGGHFNPAVSIYFYATKGLSFGQLVGYIVAQLAGAYAGVFTGLSLWQQNLAAIDSSNQVTAPVFLGEVVATAGLVLIIATLVKNKQANLIWAAVAAWIFAAGTFTVTGAQANPAVTLGLIFSGLGSGSAASLVVAELTGLVVAIILLLILDAKAKPKAKKVADKVVVSAAPAAAAPAAVAAKPAAKKPAAKKPVAKTAAPAAKTAAKPAAKKPAAKQPAAKK